MNFWAEMNGSASWSGPGKKKIGILGTVWSEKQNMGVSMGMRIKHVYLCVSH